MKSPIVYAALIFAFHTTSNSSGHTVDCSARLQAIQSGSDHGDPP